MKKILFAGASTTSGYGLDLEKNDPRLWCNQLSRLLGYTTDGTTNIAEVGLDNHEIMINTSNELLSRSYDVAVVCWQTLHRTNLYHGFELYDTRNCITAIDEDRSYTMSNGTIHPSAYKKFKKTVMQYYNPAYNIINLVKYAKILSEIAKLTNTSLYLVNFSFPWKTNKIFNYVPFDVADSFTKNEIAQLQYRSELEASEIYTYFHQLINKAGGIVYNDWVNLYEPLKPLVVDISKHNHPGYQSQDNITKFVYNAIQTKQRPT